MQWIPWIAGGVAAGWLTGFTPKGRGYGLLGNLLIGMSGGIVGGWIFRSLGIQQPLGLTAHVLVSMIGDLVFVTSVRLLDSAARHAGVLMGSPPGSESGDGPRGADQTPRQPRDAGSHPVPEAPTGRAGSEQDIRRPGDVRTAGRGPGGGHEEGWTRRPAMSFFGEKTMRHTSRACNGHHEQAATTERSRDHGERTVRPTARVALPCVLLTGLLVLAIDAVATAQTPPDAKPELRAGSLPPDLRVDGRLDEQAWGLADTIPNLTMTEPHEGALPSMATRVRVLAGRRHLVVGIECDDPDPARIVSFSKRRDPDLEREDYVAFVVDTFLDGRSGYVFAVNPDGARFDGLIEPGGEHISENWDGIWEAATARTAAGWSVEFRIPLTTVTFKKGLDTWHFNVQRQIQRFQEVNRWAGARRDWEISQMSRAGLLAGLPEFDLGLGLTVRPAVSTGGGIPAPGAGAEGDFQPSLDVWQKIGPNLLSSLTVNTDFAETEVDARRTNLTRFPLFFPEKRSFFLEGSDIFSFGFNLGQDVIPFFSRRIGLVSGREVPINVGGKLNGRVGQTNAGALVTRTRAVDDLAPAATMGVVRVKQNLWDESWLGAMATVGDPLGRTGAWTAGVDFTYATSRFWGDKNLFVGVWGLAADREDLGADAQAWGGVVDYPNDLWDVVFSYKRIGRDFDPSLGFVPRRAIHRYSVGVNFAPRPNTWVRQTRYELRPTIITDLSGRWESYRVQVTPLNWRLESGDIVEFGFTPTGERLVKPFEVSDGIVIAPGTYEWRRYEIQISTASKRRLGAEAAWETGGFYDGDLDTIELGGRWSPSALFTLQLSFERNLGRMPDGDFTEDVFGARAELNVSPDLTISSFIQYDTDSDSVGTNTRLRWTFRPEADFFVIYNHNVRDIEDRWRLDSNQLLMKMQYAWRW